MCDLFWVSPGNQGDLSDVVRASLHHHLPAATDYPQPDEEHHRMSSSPPLVEGDSGNSGGGMAVIGHGDEQLGMMGGGMVIVSHGNEQLGMMGGGDTTGPSSDQLHAVLHRPAMSATTYPQPPGLMIRRMSTPTPPTLGLHGGGVGVERDGGVVTPLPETILGNHLQHMPMVVDPRSHLHAIKRRKSQTRKVVCIPAPTAAAGRPSTSGGEVVPSDLWAWRKYGQKPIKGSPYPRGYYRCSSSKGCPARKQVERSRTDPTMLVITYTSDHNHPWPTQRNSLAGSTRPSSSSAAAAKITSSSFAAAGPGPAYSNSNDGGATAAHHQLKQEVLDGADDLDLFADMDALNIFSTKINNEDDTKEQLLDPFSSSFLDYWASFGEADM